MTKFGDAHWSRADDDDQLYVSVNLWRRIEGPKLPIRNYEVGLTRATAEPVGLREGHWVKDERRTDLCEWCAGGGKSPCSECESSWVRECDLGYEHDCQDCDGNGYVPCVCLSEARG